MTNITYITQRSLTLGADAPPLIGFRAADLSVFPGLAGHYMLGNGGFGADEQLRNLATEGASGNLTRIGGAASTDQVTATVNKAAGFQTGISEATAMTFAVAMYRTNIGEPQIMIVGGGGTTHHSSAAFWTSGDNLRVGGLNGTGSWNPLAFSQAAHDMSKISVFVGSISATELTLGSRLAGVWTETTGAISGRTLGGGTMRIGASQWGNVYDPQSPSVIAEAAIFNQALSSGDRAALAEAIEANLIACGIDVN